MDSVCEEHRYGLCVWGTLLWTLWGTSLWTERRLSAHQRRRHGHSIRVEAGWLVRRSKTPAFCFSSGQWGRAEYLKPWHWGFEPLFGGPHADCLTCICLATGEVPQFQFHKGQLWAKLSIAIVWREGFLFISFCFVSLFVCIWVCVRGLNWRIYLFHIIIISFWIIVLCKYYIHFMYSF